jgi:hypothetical protein
MTTPRLVTTVACVALFLVAACGPKDAPEAAPPTESGSAAPAETTGPEPAAQADPAALPEVRYYQISDS